MIDSLQIDSLKNKIGLLQTKVDSMSIQEKINQIQYELNEKGDIISNVNEFYDSAWVKLIILISAVGVLIPIMAQYFQRKNLKDLTMFIQNQMDSSFELKLRELKTFNQLEIESSLQKFTDDIESLKKTNLKTKSHIEANLFFSQGLTNYGAKKFINSVRDFLKSSYYELDTKNEQRLKLAISNVVISINQIKDNSELESLDVILNKSLDMNLVECIQHFKDDPLFELIDKDIEKIDSIRKKINEGTKT